MSLYQHSQYGLFEDKNNDFELKNEILEAEIFKNEIPLTQ